MDPLKESPEIKSSVESFLRNSKEYAETRLNILVLDGQEKIAKTAAGFITGAVLLVIGVFLLFFLSIGTAWYFGEMMGHSFFGFFAVAGFYLLVGILTYVFRQQWIYLPITNSMIQKMSINEED